MINIPQSTNGSKVGLDDFLMANGSAALQALLNEAKPALYCDIEDISKQPLYGRIEVLHGLFSKLAELEPLEVIPWKQLCADMLAVPARAFEAQLTIAKEEKQSRDAAKAKVDEEKKAEISRQESVEANAQYSEKAITLLKDPALLYKIKCSIQRQGVAGEEQNILIIFLAMTSRILDNPISIAVKGDSSGGKSYIVIKVSTFFPPEALIKLTGMSRQALIYTKKEFAHRTLIIFERPGMDAADYSIRTLQSENKLCFETVVKDPETGEFVTQVIEKEGPTNFITTTTSPELNPENETRNWSLSIDETARQTKAAKIETAKKYEGKVSTDGEELAIYHQLQKELKPVLVRIPYSLWLADHTPHEPLRMRRDFHKLLALIEVIALLHQYQRQNEGDWIIASLEDYYMAKELINKIFSASLTGVSDKVEVLVAKVHELYKNNGGIPVKPGDVAKSLKISSSSVSRWLRPALEAGLVEAVNTSNDGKRINSVKPGDCAGPKKDVLPSIEQLAESFPNMAKNFRATDPITGEEFILDPIEQEIKENPLAGVEQ